MDDRDAWLDGLYEAAMQARKEGREAHAVELLGCYLRYRPEHGNAWWRYGDALRILGRRNEGLAALKQAFDKAPSAVQGHIAAHIAVLLRTHVSPLEAKGWFQTATELAGGETESWMWIFRGFNLAILNEFEEAIRCFEVVIHNEMEGCDEALLNLGLVYRTMGEYGKAAAHFHEALAVSPGYQEAEEALSSLTGIAETLNRIHEGEKHMTGRGHESV